MCGIAACETAGPQPGTSLLQPGPGYPRLRKTLRISLETIPPANEVTARLLPPLLMTGSLRAELEHDARMMLNNNIAAQVVCGVRRSADIGRFIPRDIAQCSSLFSVLCIDPVHIMYIITATRITYARRQHSFNFLGLSLYSMVLLGH